MLLIWRWICFYPAWPENPENQPITNLKPRTFAKITVTSRKAIVFTRRLLFCNQICMMQAEWSSNHWAKHFFVGCRFPSSTMLNFFFVASVSCLRVCSCNKRIKPTQPPVTVAWRVARWRQKAPSFPQFWIANIQMLRKKFFDWVKPIILSPSCI